MELRNTASWKSWRSPPVKIHCSVLAEDAIKAAISDLRKKAEGGEAETLESPEAVAGHGANEFGVAVG